MRQKGVSPLYIPLIIVIVAAVAFVIGKSFGTSIDIVSIPSTTSENPTEIPTSIDSKDKSTFHKFLNLNCKQDSELNLTIQSELLPFTINPEKLIADEEILAKFDGFMCSTGYGDALGIYIHTKQSDPDFYRGGYQVYDSEDRTLQNSGGYPPVGPFPTILEDNSNMIVSIDFGWPHGGDAQPGHLRLLASVEKKLPLPNGELLYANTTETVIPNNDSRLVDLLEKYSTSETIQVMGNGNTHSEEIMVIDLNKLDTLYADIVKTFFADKNSKEWQIINQIKSQLEGIQVK